MRQTLATILLFALTSTLSFAETTESAKSSSVTTNTIGIMEVVSKSPNTIIAVPWTNFGDGKPIRIDSLVIKKNLTEGDCIYAPEDVSASKYQAWKLTGDSWVLGAEYNEFTEQTELPQEFPLARGNAFWLVRQKPTDENGNAKPIYIIGQYSDKEIKKYEFSDAGYHLLASPNPAPFTPFAPGCIEGASEGDKLYIQEPAKRIEYVYTNGVWSVYGLVESKNKRGQTIYVYKWTPADTNWGIPLGQGFWFKKSGSSDVTINWNQLESSTENN